MSSKATELNKRWARLVAKDEAAAEDVLDWSEWDGKDWVDSIIEEVSEGVHDEYIAEIASAVQERITFLTKQGVLDSSEKITPVAAGSKTLSRFDVKIGAQYQIRAGRKDRWEGVVVEILGYGTRSLMPAKVVQEGFYPVKRGGTPIKVGMRVKVRPEHLRPMDEPIDTPKDICVGYTSPISGIAHNCNNAVTTKGARCATCTDTLRRQTSLEQREREAQAERERRAEAVRKAEEAKAAEEAKKIVPGKRRVQRRGMR